MGEHNIIPEIKPSCFFAQKFLSYYNTRMFSLS